MSTLEKIELLQFKMSKYHIQFKVYYLGSMVDIDAHTIQRWKEEIKVRYNPLILSHRMRAMNEIWDQIKNC